MTAKQRLIQLAQARNAYFKKMGYGPFKKKKVAKAKPKAKAKPVKRKTNTRKAA